MKKFPDKDKIIPNENVPTLCYVKNVITNPNIIVGDYTYFDDIDNSHDFEKHVTHFYPFMGDKLIIGNFCAIARNVEFVMNGANHRMNCISTYPFYIQGESWGLAIAPHKEELPNKGDTVIGNDVWIGQNATIMPGVHIGNGAIIGTNSTVAKDVEAYTIVAGNPAKVIKKRFDDELIDLLEEFKWWNKPIEEIDELMPLLSNPNLEEVKKCLKQLLNK